MSHPPAKSFRRRQGDSKSTNSREKWYIPETLGDNGPAESGLMGASITTDDKLTTTTSINSYTTDPAGDGHPVTITETVYITYVLMNSNPTVFVPRVTSIEVATPTTETPGASTVSESQTLPAETNATTTGESGGGRAQEAGDGIPPRASAGIAIGCIVAGLIIGFIAAFFFFQRKKKQEASVAYVATSGEPKMYNAMPASATPPDSLQLNQFLPLATPDKELASELHSLGDLIQAHVENNYHLQPTSANPQVLAQALNNLGVGAYDGSPAGELASLAIEPRTRQPAIQHVLANVLFTSIDFSAKSRLTMLPAPIAAFLQSVPPTEKVGGNEDATKTALSRWRMLSAFLLNPTRSLRNTLSPSENAITPQANGLVNALNTFLDPFIPNNLKQQQADHLQAVVIECAKFGYTIFSQPSDWKFNLSSSQPGYRMAVVCAGLDKLTTNEGQPYSMPNSVAAPTLVQV